MCVCGSMVCHDFIKKAGYSAKACRFNCLEALKAIQPSVPFFPSSALLIDQSCREQQRGLWDTLYPLLKTKDPILLGPKDKCVCLCVFRKLGSEFLWLGSRAQKNC